MHETSLTRFLNFVNGRCAATAFHEPAELRKVLECGGKHSATPLWHGPAGTTLPYSNTLARLCALLPGSWSLCDPKRFGDYKDNCNFQPPRRVISTVHGQPTLPPKRTPIMRSNTGTSPIVLLLQSIALATILPNATAQPIPPTGPPQNSPVLGADHVNSRSYDLTLSPESKGKLAVSKLSIFQPPFFASPWDFGLSPGVRLTYGLTNLSGRELHVLVNYRTEGKGNNTGTGACYLLAPGEHRLIDSISPIQAFQPNLRFILMLVPLDHPPGDADLELLPANKVLVLAPLPLQAPKLPATLTTARPATPGPLQLSGVTLTTSNHLNRIIATVTNTTGQSRVGGLWVGVNHVNLPAGEPPTVSGSGFFRRESAIVPAYGSTVLTVAYDFPNTGPHPVLAFQAVESLRGMPDPTALRKRNLPAILAGTDVNLVAWGAVDLVDAAKTGVCFLVPPVPVQERTNLTAETKSPHFVFRYRPGSAAERNIDEIVAAREAVYTKLSTLYKIQLPGPVQIDLYPDMEAKGLGSGTRINVANTINASHIAEVYNAMTQVSPGHEIAHIFSYRFPGHRDRGGELRKPADAFVEGFAGCYEFDDSAETAMTRLKTRLSGNRVPSLVELIASPSPAVNDEQVALVHFLTRKSPESFKTFYVEAIARPNRKTIDLAARSAYKVSLETLENEWRQFLRSGADLSNK